MIIHKNRLYSKEFFLTWVVLSLGGFQILFFNFDSQNFATLSNQSSENIETDMLFDHSNVRIKQDTPFPDKTVPEMEGNLEIEDGILPMFDPDITLAIPINPEKQNIGGEQTKIIADSFSNLYIVYYYYDLETDEYILEVFMSSNQGNRWHRYGTLTESVRLSKPILAVDTSRSKLTWWWNDENSGFEQIRVNEICVVYEHRYADYDHDIKLWQVNPSRTTIVAATASDETYPDVCIYQGDIYVTYLLRGGIKVAKSTDQGETFEIWKTIENDNSYMIDGDLQDKEHPAIAIDRNGVVYVAYLDESIILPCKYLVKIAWASVDDDRNYFYSKEWLSAYSYWDCVDVAVSQYAGSVSYIDVSFSNDDKVLHVYSEDDAQTWSDPILITEYGGSSGILGLDQYIATSTVIVDGINTYSDILGNFWWVMQTWEGNIYFNTLSYGILQNTENILDLEECFIVQEEEWYNHYSVTVHKVNEEWILAICYYDTGGYYYASIIPPLPLPPDPPIIETPKDFRRLNISRPTFQWSGNQQGESEYKMEIYRTVAPTTIIDQAHIIASTSYTPTVDLPIESRGSMFKWRIRAKNQYGWGEWSEYAYFHIDITPPGIPIPLSPKNVIINQNTDIEFNWTYATGGNVYEIFIQDGDAQKLVQQVIPGIETHTSEFGTGFVFPNDIIYWKVRSIDRAGNIGDWSEWATFRVDTGNNYGPQLRFPEDNTTTWDTTPTLVWQPIHGDPVTYWVEICDDPVLTHIIDYDLSCPINQYTVGELDEGDYYWRVRSNLGGGNYGVWSEVYKFSIDVSVKFLDTPTLSLPWDGEVLNYSTNIAFQWSSLPSATEYHIIVDRDYPLGSIDPLAKSQFLFSNITAATTINFTIPKYYIDEQTLCWAVRARNATSIFGEWSEVYTFKIDTIPPETPSIITPENNTVKYQSYMQFNWTVVEDVDNYQFQIAENLECSSLVYSELTGQNYSDYILPGEGVYYTRVRARDEAGSYSSWSGVVPFAINLTILPPIYRSPLNNTELFENSFKLEWESINRSKPTYHIQVSSLPDFATLAENLTTSALETYISPPDGQVYWRIRAKAGTLPYGPWGPTWRFWKNNSATTQFSYPATEAILNTPAVRMTWEPIYGALLYELEISEDIAFSSVILSTNCLLNEIYLKNLTDDSYYARVRAVYSKVDTSPWSPTLPFSIHTTDSPMMYLPDDGSITNDSLTYFEWQPIKGALFYEFELASNPDFVKKLMSTSIRNFHFKLNEGLSDGMYYWRIKCNHSNGIYGDWSPIWSFEVKAVFPEIPTLLEPINNASISMVSPTFRWNGSTGYKFMQYQLQVSTSEFFEEYEINITTADEFYTVEDSLADGIWFWRVRATDGVKPWSFWSNVSYFNLSNAGAFSGKPLILYPTHKAMFENQTSITILWTPLKGATIYQLEISTFSNFAKKLLSQVVVESNYTFSCSLATYYLRVRARDRFHEYGEWSEIISFTNTYRTPSSTSSTSPTDSSTSGTSSTSSDEPSRKIPTSPLFSSIIALSTLIVLFFRKQGEYSAKK